MAKEAGTKALEDAGVKYADVQEAAVGYVYGKQMYKNVKELLRYINYRLYCIKLSHIFSFKNIPFLVRSFPRFRAKVTI